MRRHRCHQQPRTVLQIFLCLLHDATRSLDGHVPISEPCNASIQEVDVAVEGVVERGDAREELQAFENWVMKEAEKIVEVVSRRRRN